jgi:hypothetical protein
VRTADCSPRSGGDGDRRVEVDLGLVGDVASVRTEAIEGLINAGSVPWWPASPRPERVVHNVNADTAPPPLAVALRPSAGGADRRRRALPRLAEQFIGHLRASASDCAS